jgi:hypothetical protein
MPKLKEGMMSLLNNETCVIHSFIQFYSLSAKIYLHNKTLGRARRFSYKLGYPQHIKINVGNWQHQIVIVKAGFVRGRREPTFIMLLL